MFTLIPIQLYQGLRFSSSFYEDSCSIKIFCRHLNMTEQQGNSKGSKPIRMQVEVGQQFNRTYQLQLFQELQCITCAHFKLFQIQQTIMIPPQPPNQGSDLKLQGLSRDEIKKIEKSLKKPEFMGLLNEYMVEISDPKNKAEYDQYLKQMEKQGELPKHMKLVKLKPEFCFRTQIISNKNKKHQMKFFVNMCSSEYIQKPNCEAAKDEKGGVGYNWKIPNSLGKIRYDQDKHKNPCQVIDCAFHPDTFIFAFQNSAFQAMIISIALEGAEKQLGQRKETLSRDYIILKNVKCKGQNGQPALLPIRYIDGKAYNRGEGPTQQQRNTQGKQTKLQKQIVKQKQEYESQKKKEQQANKKEQQEVQEDLDDGKEKKKLIEDLEKGIQAPKFTSIYTYVTDYSEFIDGPSRKSRSLPSTFTVQFKVPRMENISQANTLEINQKKIILAVEGKYYIDLSFEDMKVKSYPLKHSEAKAKFDKKKKTLRVQIPVDVSAIPQQDLPSFQSAQQVNKDNQKAGEIVENQVWKNKVLEIPDQQEASKFLPQEQVQQSQKPAKKLIQQIDEDDYVQQAESKKQGEEQQIQQKVNEKTLESSRFTVSTYYNHQAAPAHPKELIPQQLSYIFKETSTSIVVMIYLRNYRNEDVQFGFDEQRGELVFLWIGTKPSIVHLSLTDKFLTKAKKIECFKRVGYFSLVIQKEKAGETWTNQSIRNEAKAHGVKSLSHYEQRIKQIIQQAEQRKKAKQSQQAEAKQMNERHEEQNKNKQKRSVEKQDKSDSRIETVDDSIKVAHAGQKQIQATQDKSPFQKLPFQFIKFDVKFIQTLN